MANEELANKIAGRDISHESDPYSFQVSPTADRNEYLANKIAGVEEIQPVVQQTQPVVEETPTAQNVLSEDVEMKMDGMEIPESEITPVQQPEPKKSWFKRIFG